jgi:hypothetical protein
MFLKPVAEDVEKVLTRSGRSCDYDRDDLSETYPAVIRAPELQILTMDVCYMHCDHMCHENFESEDCDGNLVYDYLEHMRLNLGDLELLEEEVEEDLAFFVFCYCSAVSASSR